MSTFTPVDVNDAESQEMIGTAKRKDNIGCLKKLVVVSIVFSTFLCVGVVITVILVIPKSEEVTDVVSLPNYALYSLRDDYSRNRATGLTLSNWEMADSLGNQDILSREDKNGKFKVQTPGFYDIRARVTFSTTSPFDKCIIYLNGYPLQTQVVSSHRQDGNTPMKSDVVCPVSRYHNLEKGDTISIGVMSGRQKTVVSRYTSFEIKQS